MAAGLILRLNPADIWIWVISKWVNPSKIESEMYQLSYAIFLCNVHTFFYKNKER